MVGRFRLGIEYMEDRCLPTGGITDSFASGFLHVIGTSAADQIHVRQTGTMLSVDNVKIAYQGVLISSLNMAAVKEIEIRSQAGADTVSLVAASTFPVPVLLSGDVG